MHALALTGRHQVCTQFKGTTVIRKAVERLGLMCFHRMDRTGANSWPDG